MAMALCYGHLFLISVKNDGMSKEEIINEVLEDWAAEFLRDVETAARLKLPSDTGSGNNSFSTDVIRAEANTLAQVMVGFQNYLRYFDMGNKNLRRDKDYGPDGMERIKDWVRRNLDKLLPGYGGPVTYKHKAGSVPVTTIINNIAWGMSKKRTRIKRRQWYVKLKASSQYKLYYRLLDELMPVMLEEMKMRIGLAGK